MVLLTFYRDPLYGRIEFPDYLADLIDEPCVRRLRFIKQLGLKSFTSFPSANHSRFEHCVGTMHLCKNVLKNLTETHRSEDRVAEGILRALEREIVTAAFLHDIGHGPFSHVIDDVLKEQAGIGHEKMSELLIKANLADKLGNKGINVDHIIEIIQREKSKDQEFVSDIVNGELDVDRMDYLLRDAYHAGIEYRFGSESLIDRMRIVRAKIADENEVKRDLEKATELLKGIAYDRIPELCQERRIGVVGDEGIVFAETLLIIRRSMYTQVYYENEGRIAEKMLEKAILNYIKGQKVDIANPSFYGKLDDFEVLRLLQESEDGFCRTIPDRLKFKQLYLLTCDWDAQEIFQRNESCNAARLILKEKPHTEIEKELSDELKTDSNNVIVDYVSVSGLEVGAIFVKKSEQEEFARPLEEVSSVARSLLQPEEPTGRLKVYIDQDKVGMNATEMKKIISRYLVE